MYIIAHPLIAIINILSLLLTVYSLVIIAAAVLSFVNPDPNHPLVRIVRNLTEPAFAKVRPYMPQISGLDLSPLVVLLAIQLVQQGVLPVFMQMAVSML